MEENLLLEGLLSMVTELKEKQEAQVTPASREETLERLNTIEQALSELYSNPAVPEKDLQAIRNQLDDKEQDAGSAETYRGHQENSIGNLPLFQGND